MKTTITTVAAYIRTIEKEKQTTLKEIRAIVVACAPDAQENIAYGMPAYTWNGKPLFYFAAMKKHIGLYPTPGPIEAYIDSLKSFSTSKGCIRIPYETTIPTKLIKNLIAYRMKEILRINRKKR